MNGPRKQPATRTQLSAIRFTMSCHFCCASTTESRMTATSAAGSASVSTVGTASRPPRKNSLTFFVSLRL